MKKVKKKGDGVIKGRPSAVLLSIVIHVVFFLLAGMLVVFTVVRKEDQVFEPPKAVERPKMKLKKPKVRIKKNSKPKATSKIATSVKRSTMPVLDLPGLGGMGNGLGGGIGDGFDIMPDLGEVSVFGSQHSIGNDFEGTVYSLALGRDGRHTTMGEDMFREKLRKYVLSGWEEWVLAPYYRAPRKLYSTSFMVPPIPTAMGPDAFGVPDLELYWLFVKYEGQLVYPEDIKFRFWGIGDAYIFVNVGGKEVLLNTWLSHYAYFDWWQSSAGGDRTYALGNQRMAVGDWIELKAGEPLDMKVLFGEWNGGEFAGMLLVEVEGEEYPTARTGGPLLPAFKTAEFSWEQLTEISRYLAADECTLTSGPVFNDYYTPPTSPKTVVAALPPEVNPAAPSAEESGTRLWALADGKTMDAELVTMVSGNAVFKNEKGRQFKVPMMKLSDADRSHIRLSMPPTLDINFSKKTKQRTFGTNVKGAASPVRGAFYTFSTQIKQSSVRPYGHPLTAECFVIGDEVGGNKHVLLDYQKAAFSLTRENKHAFEFGGPPVELLDYFLNNQNRGQRYGGFLVVIKDSLGEIVAYKTPSEELYRNLDNLRELRVGWYFDDEGNRCLPTPPLSFGHIGRN
jgi:hypothetical protein